jgi:eukaryotic-like serine/threonine-protein kinase
VQPVQALRTEDPERIGDFTVLGRLGRGAMGTVYLARSAGGRRVAIKVARPELAEDARFRERFRNEVAMARAVGGFWTAAVVDADPDAPRPWLATEFVPGPTLHDVVAAHGPMPEPDLRRLVAGLAEALLAIHATGLVHRDLKPSNVLLGADGPRVIDFGIAKALVTTGLTATGMLIGTPGYLSPEQIAGGPVTAASDVFALGSVLVYAATGTGPFGSGDAAALMYRVVNGEPRLDDVPPALVPLATRCLSRDPAARPTPAAILTDLSDPDPPTPTVTLAPPTATDVASRPTAALPGSTGVHQPSSPAAAYQPTAPLHDPNVAHHPAAALPGPTWAYPAPPMPVDGNRAVFKTSRTAALVGGGVALAAALTCSAIAGAASRTGQDGLAFVWFVGFVLLMIPAVRLLWSAVRSRRTLELSADGMTIGVGTRKRRLAWPQIARVRVVQTRGRPWLVIWLTDQNDSLGALAGPYRGEHGGYRVFPVGHERRKKGRLHEVRELRAALAWYARGCYDWSP